MTDRNRELKGKVAIITGSARNIGRATAEELARAGASVTINAVKAQNLCDKVADGINKSGGSAISVLADITKQDGVDRLANETIAAFGGIDILILNAAIRIDVGFPERTFKNWRQTFAVAVDGGLRLSMACVPSMIERGGGSVVGIHGMQSYTAAAAKSPAVKDAQAGMLRGMARDLGENNINCNIAVVGPFDTDRAGGSGELAVPKISDTIPIGRRGTPQDMADAVRFLVGPFGHYISGQTLHLNGGIHMPH
ncbi:MAG: short-chain dehydrogenase [Rhodospirillaceae bacterium]|nr:short-chain dehydrogenase [Rhodospirillaceae bacterium]